MLTDSDFLVSRPVFATARWTMFEYEYLYTGSTCAADVLEFKATVPVLVNVWLNWGLLTHVSR